MIRQVLADVRILEDGVLHAQCTDVQLPELLEDGTFFDWEKKEKKERKGKKGKGKRKEKRNLRLQAVKNPGGRRKEALTRVWKAGLMDEDRPGEMAFFQPWNLKALP